MRAALRTASALIPLLAAALALPSPATAEVKLDAPFTGSAVPGPIPPLPVSGALPDAPLAKKDANALHEARFSIGFDVASPPSVGESCTNLPPASPLGLPSVVAPAFEGYVNQARSAAAATQDKIDAGVIEDIFAAFETASELAGGDTTVDLGDAVRRCVSPPPLHARWLASQWSSPGPVPIGKGETLYGYHPQPQTFRETRLRGARLYCAAREAQLHQSPQGASLGERAAFSVKVLGEKIDFLVTEQRVVLDGPKRFTGMGAADGAQAFEVPFQLGTRITPIRGLGLDGFDELRVPLSLIAGDTELRTPSDLRGVLMGSTVQCGFEVGPPFPCKLVPIFETLHSKLHHTATHVDAVATAGKDATVFGNMPLFTVGFVTVSLGYDFDFFLGQLFVGENGTANSRVLSLPPLPLPPSREGRVWTSPLSRLHDGPWGLRLGIPRFAVLDNFPVGKLFWTVLPDGETDPFWRELVTPGAPPPPLDLRVLQNDDHALESATGIGVTGTLSGELGRSFGPFTLTLTVTGALSGSVSGRHVIRDALYAQDLGGGTMTPVTGLGMRSRTSADATLDPATGKLRFQLSLPWPFDDIDFQKTLFSVPSVKLAQYSSDDELVGSESDALNLRLGTGSAAGAVTSKPVVLSHLPQGGEFPSFPVDVAACLADPKPNPPTPPPCKATKDPGAPPAADVCIYAQPLIFEDLLGVVIPANVCAHLPSFLASLDATPEQAACAAAFLGYVCSPVSKSQVFEGQDVVSHVVDFDDEDDANALANALELCATAFAPPSSGDPDGDLYDSNVIGVKLVSAGVCKADGTLLAGDEILGAIDPFTPPPKTPGPECVQ